MLKTALPPEAVAELQAQIRADPTPPIVVEEREPFDKLASNKAGRDRLRARGGLSTTINITPDGWAAIHELKKTYVGVDTNADAINLALRWLVSHIATAPKGTLKIGG